MIPHAGIPNGTYWDNGFNFYNSGWLARSTIVSPTRWQAEYRIPFTAVDTLDGTGFVPLAVGDTIGFNLLVNDADFGNARTHQLAWNGITHNDQLYRQQQAWVPVRIVPRATSESWELR